ncbi:sigma-70 family RNA polymerase sigma factor [candidate division KSB1 bacterium]|nr:sigma-70 family RNA polymerase sigma factor [candidate division KSB1 bacterium]
MFQKAKQNWEKCLKQNPEKGWKHFLECYNDLFMAIIKKYAFDYDAMMDMYTYILEKLKRDNYSRIITYYKSKRQYRFEPWLAVTIRNCCIDWLRKQHGRKRVSGNIKELPLLDQLIYKYKFWFHYSDKTIYEIITTNYEHTITPEEIVSHIDKITTLVKKTKSPLIHNNPQIFLINDKDVKPASQGTLSGKEQKLQADQPDSLIISDDIKNIYKKIIAGLTVNENLLLNLYFYRGLTLEQIARILKIKNIWRVHRLLKKLLAKIKRELESYSIDSSDIENILK